MALTQIKTTAIADDAVTTDKLANAINTERTANTAKATNATHTGEVTGSGALTIANDAVTGAKIADDAVGAEHIEVLDAALQFGDNVKAQFGASNDLEIYHNGTDTGLVNNTGGLYIQNDGTVFIGDVGGNEFGAKFIDNGAVELYYDNSKKFETYSGGVEWHGNLKNETDGVNEGIYLGAQNDFGLYHDGSNSFLLNNTGNLYIQGDSSSTTEEILIRPKSGEQSARFIANGAVSLYYDNGLRALTTANGFQVEQSAGVDVEFRIKNSTNTNASATNYILSEHDGRTTAKIVFGRNGDANDFSASAATTQGDIQFHTTSSGTSAEKIRIRANGSLTSNHGNNSITYGGFPQPNFFGKSFTSHAHAGLQLEANGNDTLGGISQHDDHLALHNSYRNAGGYKPLQCHIGGANRMTIATNGVISGDFNDTSDANLKENVASIPDGSLAIIKQLRPVTFDWKNLGKEVDTNHDSITGPSNVSGFLAQEVKPLIPSVVEGTEWDESKPDGDRYSINTNGLVAHLTKALQEAITEIETLKTKVAALESA